MFLEWKSRIKYACRLSSRLRSSAGPPSRYWECWIVESVLNTQSVEWRCCRWRNAFQVVCSEIDLIVWKVVPPGPESSVHHSIVAEFSSVLCYQPVWYRITNVCTSTPKNIAIVANVLITDTDLHSNFPSWYLKSYLVSI